MTPDLDAYSILGVPPAIDAAGLKAAYRALLKKYHPDVFVGSKAEAQRRTTAIIAAYELLSDPVRRKAYDASHSTKPGPVSRTPAAAEEREQEEPFAEYEFRYTARTYQTPATNRAPFIGAIVLACAVLVLASLGNRFGTASKPYVGGGDVHAAGGLAAFAMARRIPMRAPIFP